jgi:CTP:molybdopterin cytidylyltransferase MocA
MIPAVILAAGKSTRMGGRPKALLPIGDQDTFLTKIVSTFRSAGVEDVIVVLGHEAEAVVDMLRLRGSIVRVVVNDRYGEGQFSSVVAGLNVVDRPGVRAFLLTLVDVPLVSAATVRQVIDCYRRTGAPIVRPVSGERHGHPVLIDRSLFASLRAGDPAAGAKPIVRAHVSAAGDVTVDDEGAFTDIDTPDDYARLTGRR